MRDTSPGVESRAASERFFDEFMAHQNTKPKDERNPLKAMIPDAVFLTRVTELLQGLASKLNTRVEYMDIMARFCKLAIIESVPRAIAETPEGPIAGRPPISFLDRKVRLHPSQSFVPLLYQEASPPLSFPEALLYMHSLCFPLINRPSPPPPLPSLSRSAPCCRTSPPRAPSWAGRW